MKKTVCLIIVLLLCFLLLAACNNNRSNKPIDYVSKSDKCVVSLPKDYLLSFENENVNECDIDLYNADTVNGKPKNDGCYYYSVPCGEPFRIVTPLGIISDKHTNSQTLVYWKLNDTLYKDSDCYYSENIFMCALDTDITPIYYEFRAVGMLLLEVDDNYVQKIPDGEIFNDNGNIIDQDGVWYLYGVYDFEPNREFWRTNLTLNKYTVNRTVESVAGNYGKNVYSINVEINSDSLFGKGKIAVYSLFKIEGHGYMSFGSAHIIGDDNINKNIIRTLPIGEHEIKYLFAE